MKLSPGEEAFQLHCRVEKLMPLREFQFNVHRRWRFDFAFPESYIAVEIEGGHFTGGRHGRGTGFEKDCEKYNSAALLGWRVLRYTTGMVYAGTAIDEVLQALKLKERGPRIGATLEQVNRS